MSEIVNAQLVKELREKTGAGMMDCKKALAQCSGDLQAAADWLKKEGLASANKKAGRIAAEGGIGINISKDNKKAALVELNSETDFVGKNEKFQSLLRELADIANSFSGNLSNIKEFQQYNLPAGITIEQAITENIVIIGENLNLRRATKLSVEDGVVASYIHNAIGENIGKVGVLVAIESKAEPSKLIALGKQIAMHIAAAKPEALDIKSLNQEFVNKEKNMFYEQAKSSGKPDAVIEKMIEGRVRKLYEEVVLLEQIFVIDGKNKIRDIIDNASKELGEPIEITGFARFALGEGVERS